MINLNGFTLQIEGHILFSDLHLSITEGEITSFTGPSGIGKSTLLRSLVDNKLGVCDTSITINDTSWDFIGQHDHLLPWYTVARSLDALGVSSEKLGALTHLLDEFEIKNLLNNDYSSLSGGEKQRLAIFTSLCLDPKVIILDEPYNALDVPLKLKCIKALKKHVKNENITLIIVSHDLDIICFMSDKIWIAKNDKTISSYDNDLNSCCDTDEFLCQRSKGSYDNIINLISHR